jgi:hypothetical protein
MTPIKYSADIDISEDEADTDVDKKKEIETRKN